MSGELNQFRSKILYLIQNNDEIKQMILEMNKDKPGNYYENDKEIVAKLNSIYIEFYQ